MGTSKLNDHLKKHHPNNQKPISHFSTHTRNIDSETKEVILSQQINLSVSKNKKKIFIILKILDKINKASIPDFSNSFLDSTYSQSILMHNDQLR